MSDFPPVPPPPPEDRLDSWKEIAGYLRRDVTTVQRWERREGMPVHRHVHDKVGSVYAFRSELDAWSKSRTVAPEPGEQIQAELTEQILAAAPSTPARRFTTWWLVALGISLGVGLSLWRVERLNVGPDDPLAGAHFQQLTGFGGSEQAAALSRDGRFAAFLSDRDGRMDVWLTQIGTGEFHNLTHGTAPELVNPSVRTLGFSPDGAMVTFWARRAGVSNQSTIGIWAVPVLGGAARPYLETVAEFDWSPDGSRLVYHTAEAGDPMFVQESGQPARRIFSAPAGLHAHFPIWSPDQAFIYFVEGTVPDRMDIWRIRPTGGAAERLTSHEARVSHPVFLDRRTLLYLATDQDGSGPFLYALHLDQRSSQRVSFGLERYTSLAASVDGRRLVATQANRQGALWRLPLAANAVSAAEPVRISLTTGSGVSPRLGPGFLLYVASKSDGDSIWKLDEETASRVWSAPGARVVGAPAISRDGRQIAFVAFRNRQTSLCVGNADGTNVRALRSALPLTGDPAWAPDGRSLAVGAEVDGSTRLVSVPLDGGDPRVLVRDHARDAAWSPDGHLLAWSGRDIGTTFPVFISIGGGPPQPKATLTRGSRHLGLMPDGRGLVVLRGDIRHKDLWLIDLDNGAERQLTRLPSDFSVGDFDISPDGREIVLEQVQEQTDIVLIDISGDGLRNR